MAFHGPSSRWLFVDGYELVGGSGGDALKDISPTDLTAVLEEVTGPSDTRPQWRPTGFVDAADLTYTAWYGDEAAATNWLRQLRSDIGTGTIASLASREMLWGNDGETLGAACYGASVLSTKVAMQLPSREFTKGVVTHRITGGVDFAKLLCFGAQATGDTGDTKATSLNNGGASTNGGIAYLMVSSITMGGASDVIIKVEDSADDANWTDLVTFTAVATAPGTLAGQSSVIAAAATVKQYLAVSWNFTGGGAGSGLTMAVAFARR